MTIYFYDAGENPYGCFSNFAFYRVQLSIFWCRTSEHYFQAQKFEGSSSTEREAKRNDFLLKEILAAKTPELAIALAENYRQFWRSDWEEVKDQIMHQGVLSKFNSHRDIRKILLSTGELEIVYHSPSDYYWGCGEDGTGDNKLGKILMSVRNILQKKTERLKNHPSASYRWWL
ncbi:hypothetical protein Sta7437_4833 (plasmid) [Stanieria cyanosphaera PCC 7437]|uniref:NADAR domain-containing protein n=1 Tax=Stanieria cyanosphaera (strain ATCC 29371 / PCC 7437) TaxID=111780 RepID=K9Y1I3_STAC7|nr:NADAR family protein [Stanieria cyanosphaera]AFZ38266.1 hypothetical protein Sta7437_4833 [Stanieria cyanosphaera PCC 7437]